MESKEFEGMQGPAAQPRLEFRFRAIVGYRTLPESPNIVQFQFVCRTSEETTNVK